MRNVILSFVVLAGTGGFFVAAYDVFSRDYRYLQLVKLGDQLMEEELYYQARRTYGSAIGLRPGKALGYLKRAQAFERQGNLSLALEDLSEAARLNADPNAVSERIADVYYARGNFDEAAVHYYNGLERDPSSPSVLYKLGLACFRAGREVESLDALTQAVELQEDFAEAYYLRSAVMHTLGRHDEAEADLLETLFLRPDSEESRRRLFRLYMDTDQIDKALQMAEDAVDQQPQAPLSYLMLADVKQRQGLNDEAIDAVGLALEQRPNLPEAYFRLGELWLEEGIRRNDRVAIDKSVAALESVVTMDPESGPASLALGRAYLAAGEEDQALIQLQRAAEATPIEPEAHRLLGDLYQSRQNFVEATSAYHVYMRLGEPSPAVLERLGDAFLSMGNENAAAETYLQVAAREPSRVGPLIKAARAYLAASEPELALRACHQGLAVAPEDPRLHGLRRRATAAAELGAQRPNVSLP